MTNEIKTTNKSALNYVLTNCELPTEIKEKIEKMVIALEKKSANRSDKPSKTQEANAELKEVIADAFADGRKATVSETIKSVEELHDLSNQKVSRLLNDLVKDGKFDKEVIKGKTYFFAI